MRLEEAVYKYLIAQIAVFDKISDRLYPLLLPQKCQLPAVVYSLISLEKTPALQKDTDLIKQTLQFSCHSKSYAEAISIAEILRKVLQDYSGNMNGLFIGAVLVASETASYEPKTESYSAYIEFEFQFNET